MRSKKEKQKQSSKCSQQGRRILVSRDDKVLAHRSDSRYQIEVIFSKVSEIQNLEANLCGKGRKEKK